MQAIRALRKVQLTRTDDAAVHPRDEEYPTPCSHRCGDTTGILQRLRPAQRRQKQTLRFQFRH